jgi:hypothetical protein
MPGRRSASVSIPSANAAVRNAGRGSRPGLLQLAQDIAQRHLAALRADEAPQVDRTHALGVTDQFDHRTSLRARDAFDHRIRLRMHRRGVERVVATRDAQKAGALLEGARPETRHGTQRFAAAKRTVAVAVIDDRLCQRPTEPRDAPEQRSRGAVQLHTDAVHAILDHRVEAL